MSFRIYRHDKEEDLSLEIYELQVLTLPDDAVILPDDAVWWIVYSGQDPVAHCAVQQSEHDPGRWFLIRAGVLKAYRGQGLQKRMIRKRLSFLRAETDAYLAYTYTSPHNVPSSNSLISTGFKLYRPEELYAGDEMLYWKKDITR